MRRDGERLPSARWSEPPGDPHRDVTGALHDVSNALTVVLGWVAEVRTYAGSPEQIDRALAIIEDRARSARDLARRAIGAQPASDDREGDLKVVVDDVVEALSVEAQRARVRIVVRASPLGCTRLRLAADASQVLTNVVLNALAWAPPGSVVTIEVGEGDPLATIVVQDEGPGVPPGEASRIFEGATGRDGGAGVGLKHARALARAAGGDLELVLETGRPGARFCVRWPIVHVVSSIAPAPSSRPSTLSGTRVLLVEDDIDVAMLLETALGCRGAHIAVARTGRELLEHARETHDVALVDLSPIAGDVHGAIAALRRSSPGMSIVFITGSVAGVPEGLEDGTVRWVRKPFEIAEIIAAISEMRAFAAGAGASERSGMSLRR